MTDPVNESTKALEEASDQIKDAPKNLDEAAESLREQLVDSVAAFVDRLPFFIAALTTLLVTWGLSRLLSRVIERLVALANRSRSKQVLIGRGVSLVIWSAGILVAVVLAFPGLTVSKAFAAIAIASVAFGFAFRDLFENLFAGVMLLSQFPFDHGDFIDSGAVSGTVEQITLRMTRVRTVAGELIVVPNSRLYRSEISILTNREKRRTHLDLTVAYGTELDRATAVVSEAIRSCESVAAEPEPEVLAVDLGDHGVQLELAWWTSPKPLEIRRSRSEVVTASYEALASEGIEIPYPQRDVNLNIDDAAALASVK